MLEQPEGSDDIIRIANLLSAKIARVQQVANETGVRNCRDDSVEAVLRRTRNGSRPVNKLPPEILSQIFSLIPENPMRDFGRHALVPVADRHPLLSVCSLWRSVATTSPFLWSTFDNRDPRAFFIASKYRPVNGVLDVNIIDPFHPHRIPTLYHLLHNEGHRIREFCVEIPAQLLLDLTECPGESLEMCQIRLRQTMDSSYIEDIGLLFMGYTPKLRSLLIQDLLFIPMNDFPSLTHLTLGGFRLDPSTEGTHTFTSFVSFLSRCPNLEALHLYGLDAAYFRGLPEDGLIAPPLNLPHLRKLSNEELLLDHSYPRPEEFYFGPQFRRAILAHLQLSPDCLIRLATILPHDLARTIHTIPFDTPLTSMYFGEGNSVERECLSIMAGTDPHRHHGLRIDFQMPGKRYVGLSTASVRVSVCDAIRGAPLLASVHELWATPTATLMLGEPYSIIGSLPHLTTPILGLLTLLPDFPADVRCQFEPLGALEVRDGDEDDDDDDDGPVIPCPRLRTLCVYVTTEEHVIDLYAMLLSRGEAGYPIHRLVVGFCGPPQHTVLELAEGLTGLIEDVTIITSREQVPKDLSWVHRLPFVCRNSPERNRYWPAWL